ncbi:MAG: adenosylcobinamide-GDP ribazoletransferase [Pseudomonadota bacterium]|nr:adenosylcobinamide-GDP ribazoletransferase [Pseudomonadota bacterium]
MSSEIERNPISALRTATVFLTRIPVGGNSETGHGPLASSVWMFPFVGALVGLLGGLIYYASQALGLPVAISAALGVCVLYVVTGGLHEDGLADVADGFGGGASRERKLAIMRDSRIGTYGVAAMVFSILLRILAIVSIADAASVAMALLAAGALSRAAIGPVMAALPSARPDGLSAAAGRPGGGQALLAIGIAMVGAIAFLGFGAGIVVTVLALMTLCLVAALAKKQIGGQTGDVLGTTAQCVEIVVLLAISAR